MRNLKTFLVQELCETFSVMGEFHGTADHSFDEHQLIANLGLHWKWNDEVSLICSGGRGVYAAGSRPVDFSVTLACNSLFEPDNRCAWSLTRRKSSDDGQTAVLRFSGTRREVSGMDPLFLSLVSACTALVASTAGPIVTLIVAKRQINATVLSANRQKWIESLRDLVAELVSLLVAAAVARANWKESWNKGQALLASSPAWLEKLERLVRVQWKIRLLLNPTEPDHQTLDQAIDTAIKRLQLEAADDTEIEADLARITSHAQIILKREWVRVKRCV